MVNGIGGVLTKNLFNRFQNPEDIFKAPKKELLIVEGIKDKNVESIKSFKDWEIVEKELAKIEKWGIKLLPLNDPEYPGSLMQIYNPPPILYMSGEILPQDKLSIAIVGSRIPNRYGRTMAESLSGELASMGVTIVSGLARGIDSIAQSEALKRGGRTIGVLGCGLDVVYPPENKKLYKEVSQNGAILSEFPLETPPIAQNFPRRNRIICGLSLGVASDSLGNIWVSNSGIIRAPCDGTDPPTWIQVLELSLAAEFSGKNASVTLINADGDPVGPFKGGGLLIPWGIAVDGNDNVWVANFQGKAVSQLCGAAPQNCPPGFETGDPISPDGGYFFDGLKRNTAVQIDPSGNVWLTNNWEIIADPENPGGHELVVFIGLAKPIQTPLIVPPQK